MKNNISGGRSLIETDEAKGLNRYQRFVQSPNMPYKIAPLLLGLFLIPLSLMYYDGASDSLLKYLPSQIIRDSVFFCLLAIGASIIISLAQIDISSIGVATLSGVIYALILSYTDSSAWFLRISAWVACLGFGLSSGTLVAFCFHRLKAPLLILTWALGSIYIIIAILLTGLTKPSLPHDVSGISLEELTTNSFWAFGQSGFLLCLSLICAAIIIPEWSSLADRAKAIGSGENSAQYAGVPIVRTYYQAFIFNALLAVLAGILHAFYLNRASTIDLRGQELVPIAIAVLGGTSLSGGYLFVPSVVAAAVFWTVIRLLGPMLPSIFPILTAFQAELGQIIFFMIFIGISLVFGKLLGPRLSKITARQEN